MNDSVQITMDHITFRDMLLHFMESETHKGE